MSGSGAIDGGQCIIPGADCQMGLTISLILATAAFAGENPDRAKFAFNRELVEANLLTGVESTNFGLRTSAAMMLGNLKSDKAVFALMRMLVDTLKAFGLSRVPRPAIMRLWWEQRESRSSPEQSGLFVSGNRPGRVWMTPLRFCVEFRLEDTPELFRHSLERVVPAKVVPEEPGGGVVTVVVPPAVPVTVAGPPDLPDKGPLTDAACCFFYECHGAYKELSFELNEG